MAEQPARAGRHSGDRAGLAAPVFLVARPAEVDRQRRDPRASLQGRGRNDQGLQADACASGLPRRSVLRALQRRRHGARHLSVRAEHGVLRARPDQRRLQMADQPSERRDGRAHAAPLALRSRAPAHLVRARGDPWNQAGRGGQHDQQRGRADRRVHRRCLRAAGLPRHPGADRSRLHPGAERVARHRGGRHRGDPGRHHPDLAPRADQAREAAPDRLAPARGTNSARSSRARPPSARMAPTITSAPRSAPGSRASSSSGSTSTTANSR